MRTLLLFITPAVIMLAACSRTPEACFSAPAKAYVGEAVSFTNCSQDADKYEWEFGDGGTSTDKSPTHAYNAPGVYSITMEAFNERTDKESVHVQEILIEQQTGQITFWKDGVPFADTVVVSITGSSQTVNITASHAAQPACGASGTAVVTLPQGTYEWFANHAATSGQTTGQVTVTSSSCTFVHVD